MKKKGTNNYGPLVKWAFITGLLGELIYFGLFAILYFGVIRNEPSFKLGFPEGLWILPFLPLLFVGYLSYLIWKKRTIKRFGDPSVVEQNFLGVSNTRSILKYLLFRFGIGILVFALLNPQVGTSSEKAETKGIDLMVCVDLSNSMKAEDIRPSRLEKAKLALEKLLDRLHGDRVGMIVFAGEAYVQLPITSDISAAKLFLDNLDTDIVPVQGTSMGSAIDLAVRSFEKESNTKKAIIVISDGENHLDDPIEAAKRASEEDILVHTIGMGSKKGAPIPLYKRDRQVGYKKSPEGNTIISKLNEEVLVQTAEEGNGTFIRANNTRVGLDILMDELKELDEKTFKTRIYTDHEDRFQLFLLPGLILLILEQSIGKRRGFWKDLFKTAKDR